MKPKETKYQANGLSHHVLEWGSGNRETIVLCHGFLDMAWSFQRLAEQLATEFRVVAIDFRGHGETEWVGAGGYYHFFDYVLDLHELVPQLSDRPVHLLGHSMGGTVCAYYAALHPKELASLILAEGLGPLETPAAFVPDKAAGFLSSVDRVRTRTPKPISSQAEALKRMRVQNPDLEDEWGAFLATKATIPLGDGEGYRWRFDPLHKTTAPTPFFVESFREFLLRIAPRTLAVFGSEGFRVPDEAYRLRSIPVFEKVEIEGAKHMLHWSHPEELASAVSDFAHRLREPQP